MNTLEDRARAAQVDSLVVHFINEGLLYQSAIKLAQDTVRDAEERGASLQRQKDRAKRKLWEFEEPEYPHNEMDAGLKLRHITDCQSAMGYGWDNAIAYVRDSLPDLYTRPADDVSATERVKELKANISRLEIKVKELEIELDVSLDSMRG